jgi:phage terminase large subunit-like protein
LLRGFSGAERVYLCGRFAMIEAELMRIVTGEAPRPSPDRANSMVWGLTNLMLKDMAGGCRGSPASRRR